MGKIPILPTVDQFPSFDRTLSWLEAEPFQCIWYLPNRRRYCGFEENYDQSVFQLAIQLLQGNPLTTQALQLLAAIAESSCCAGHHRNKIWGSNLASDLAIRWQQEIKDALRTETSRVAKLVKVENLSPLTSSEDHPERNFEPVDRTHENIPIHHLSTLTAFSKHVVYHKDTLASTLLSTIDLLASKSGSVYLFTYKGDDFLGMIKIGFTSRPIDCRLHEWTECGHGSPILLELHKRVRHPKRVELLTHFELLKYWYEIRWCKIHGTAHIEWFKIDLNIANQIVQSWSLWMDRANPYDRRGQLKTVWAEFIECLMTNEIDITAEMMMQIQEVEEGLIDITDLLDDDMLRKQHKTKAKEERVDEPQAISSLPNRIKIERTEEENHEIKSTPVKVEIIESEDVSGKAGTSTLILREAT